MKPRPDLARYKRLSASRQETIFKWLTGDPAKKIRALSYKAAVTRIKKEWGKKFTCGQLQQFYSWYPSSRSLREAKGFREKVAEFLIENPDLDLESDRVLKAGQIVFEQDAIERRDKQLYIGLRRLRQKDLDQSMDRDQFEIESIERFLKWYAMTKMRELADSDLQHSTKIAAMRKLAFQDVDALEASGKVHLPTQ
jgi:hypothetical protein